MYEEDLHNQHSFKEGNQDWRPQYLSKCETWPQSPLLTRVMVLNNGQKGVSAERYIVTLKLTLDILD